MTAAKRLKGSKYLVELAAVVQRHERRRQGRKVVVAREKRSAERVAKPVVLLFGRSKR
jgi:hypothetical protein